VRGNPTVVRLRNANTGVLIAAEVPIRDGRSQEEGDHVVAGVPGSGAPVVTRYLRPAGAVLGAALPTGRPVDRITTPAGELDVSVVDLTHPYAIVRAADVGITLDGADPAALNTDPTLLDRLEAVRAAVAVRLGRVERAEDAASVSPAVPRLALVGSGDDGAQLRVLGVSMGRVHRALMMTGALCVAGAVRLAGTIPATLAGPVGEAVRLRHPRGVVEVLVDADGDEVRSVGITRTARRLMEGWAYLPTG
jgi:2-methylaconitate cis-trans-isomerase PrpF